MGLSLSEGLGISSRGSRARVHLHACDSACRSAPLQEQSRYSASAAPAKDLHGALRLAAPTAGLNSWLRRLVDAGNARAALTLSSIHPSADMPARTALLHPVAASGGFLASLDWPALTPALTEIRRLLAACRLAFSCHRSAPGSSVPIDSSWLLDSRRQAHFLLEHHTTFCLMPNVRVKPAPTAWRAGRQAQNGP